MSNSTAKHPQGLYVLFATEMWERFSYYGMRAILALYLMKALLYSKELASQIYGTYTGLVYLTPLIGGYVADRYWGNRRSIIVGGLLMAAGQFFMFLSSTFYQSHGITEILLYTALGLLIFGNGFFKPNISTMVGQLYPPGDKKIDSAFTLFYMGINLGAFISPLVCGALGETNDPGDYRWGFLAACIGMILGVVIFVMMKDKYIVTPDGTGIGIEPNKARDEKDVSANTLNKNTILMWCGIIIALFLAFFYGAKFDFFGSIIFAGAIGFPGLIISDSSLNNVEKDRIWVIYISAFFVVFFWSAFEQAGASLTFFADEQTDRIVNISMNLGVVYLLIGAFLFILYKLLSNLMNTPIEFEWFFRGLGVLVACLVIYGFISGKNYDLPEIPASWFQSVNAVAIVIFAPGFSILWQKMGDRNIEPAAPTKQAWGLLLLSLGYLLMCYKLNDLDPTLKVSMFWLTALYVLHTWGELCLSPIGLSMVAKLAPARFASLLMGVWFLANATANKFAGMLSALYPETGKTTQFLGYHMSNLYEFFMLFVMMAGAASLILFLSTRKLQTMMHGVR